MNVHRALILAAGRGSRLSAMTAERPKCLLPFLGRSLLEWQTAALKSVGIDDVHIVRGYRGELLNGVHASFWENPEWQSTNMVHSLICARPLLERGEPLAVTYGDIVFEPRSIAQALKKRGDVVVAVNRRWRELWQMRMEDPLLDVETLKISPAGLLTDIGRKARSLDDIDGQYMGMILLSGAGGRQLLEFLDAASDREDWMMGRSKRDCQMTDLLRGLIQVGVPVSAAPVDGGWLEFDTVEDVTRYESLAGRGGLNKFFETASGW